MVVTGDAVPAMVRGKRPGSCACGTYGVALTVRASEGITTGIIISQGLFPFIVVATVYVYVFMYIFVV